jgi:hypothetical protein
MTPKSYMNDTERNELRAGGMTENGICLAESEAADNAGDDATSWAWLARAELPADSLLFLKDRHGADFIRDMGFRTVKADAAYGPSWLEHAK